MELKSFQFDDLRRYRQPQESKDDIVRGLESLFESYVSDNGGTPPVDVCRAWLDDLNVSVIVAVHGVVYDLGEFIFHHPGGASALLVSSGTDASNIFEAVGHTVRARSMLSRFIIGRIDEDEGVVKDTPVRKTAQQRKMEQLRVQEIQRQQIARKSSTIVPSVSIISPVVTAPSAPPPPSPPLNASATTTTTIGTPRHEQIPYDVLDMTGTHDLLEVSYASEPFPQHTKINLDNDDFCPVDSNVVVTPRKQKPVQEYHNSRNNQPELVPPRTPIYNRTPASSTSLPSAFMHDHAGEVQSVPLTDVTVERNPLSNATNNSAIESNIFIDEGYTSDREAHKQYVHSNDHFEDGQYQSGDVAAELEGHPLEHSLYIEHEQSDNNDSDDELAFNLPASVSQVSQSPSLQQRNNDRSSSALVRSNVVVSPPRKYHAPLQFGDVRQRTHEAHEDSFLYASSSLFNGTVYITPQGTPTKPRKQ